jgi:hypothetical protein
MDGATRNEAEILRKIVSEVISKARGWLVSRNVAQQNLPQNIRTQIPGWIAEELLPILYPFTQIYERTKMEMILLGFYSTKFAVFPTRNLRVASLKTRIPQQNFCSTARTHFYAAKKGRLRVQLSS